MQASLRPSGASEQARKPSANVICNQKEIGLFSRGILRWFYLFRQRKVIHMRITVNNKFQIIYQKAEMHSAFKLRAFGKSQGFDCYISANLLFHQLAQVFQPAGGAV
ncbi:MAG: hypothetical protein ACL7BU_06645 [Candidatus Phlomobacter fragariae]